MKALKAVLKAALIASVVCMSQISAAVAGTTIAGMGADYFFYDLGTYNPNVPDGPGNSWYQPGETVKTPIGLYQLMPTKVDAQLADMRKSGMDYVVLIIQMEDLAPCKAAGSCTDNYPQNWLWGYLLDDSAYQLRTMQRNNLVSLLQDIRKDGFRKVIIRFSDGSVRGWGDTWNETEYQMGWNVIASVHRLVSQQLDGSMTRPIYDLGMELIGGTAPETQNYMHRLWSDYTYTFGTSDTVGFSTIADSWHLQALSWYGTLKPQMYAFDIYGDVGAGLTAAWNALGSEQTKPIIIMETYPNDPLTENQVQSALAAHPGMNVIALSSWPTGRNVPTCSTCTPAVSSAAIQALNTTTQLSNFTALASKVVFDNSSGGLLSLTDVNCGSTYTSTCSIKVNEGYAPVSGEYDYQVYVTSPQLGGSLNIMSCGSGGAAHPTVNWIQRNISYEFEYYRVSSCSDSVAGRSPDATSIVSVR